MSRKHKRANNGGRLIIMMMMTLMTLSICQIFKADQIIRKHKRANNGGRLGREELTGDRVLSPARGSLTRWYEGNLHGCYDYQVKNSLLECFPLPISST